MSRKSNNSQTSVDNEDNTMTLSNKQEEEMDGSGVGIIKTSTGGYRVVKLEFNSQTGTSRLSKMMDVGSSKLEASERFKIMASEEGLV